MPGRTEHGRNSAARSPGRGTARVPVLPLDLAQAREFALLETMRDPFDRMLVAAARAAGTSLVTADTAIRDSALVEIVWD